MTTICTDGISLAADGRVHSDGTRVRDDEKKIMVRGGVIYALGGVTCLFDPLIKWVTDGADPEKIPKGDLRWQLLVITRTAFVTYSNTCPYAERQDYPFTTGSGRDVAYGAMKAGKSPREAVAIAAEDDLYTGGEIQVVNIAEALGLAPIKEAAE